MEVFKFKQYAEIYIQKRMDRIDTNFDFAGFNALETSVQALSQDIKTNLMLQLNAIKKVLTDFDKSLTNNFLQPEQVQQLFISK